MHKIELNIKGLFAYKLTSFDPKREYEQKELSGSDWLTLYGAAAMLARANYLTADFVLGAASICDNKLYLNDFEGYILSDRLRLQALYLTPSNRVVAMVYDNKKDRFIDFITW